MANINPSFSPVKRADHFRARIHQLEKLGQSQADTKAWDLYDSETEKLLVQTFGPGHRYVESYKYAMLAEAEAIVQTCCLKTHQYGGHFTLSLKNSVGLVPRVGYNYMNELHSSSHQRQLIAEINTAYSPDLVVLDGVEAFVEGGPATGKKV